VSEDSSRGAASRTPWPLVLLIFGAGVIAAFQVGKAAIALPTLRGDLDLSLAAAGWILSIFSVVGATAASGIGAVTGRFSDRGALIAGLSIIAVASLGGALAPGAGWLLVSRFVEGLGFIVVVVSAPVLLARLARPADYKFVFAVWSGYFPTGSIIMLLLGPWLLRFGWRWLWVANAALVLAFLVPFAVVTRHILAAQPRRQRPARGIDHFLRDLRRTVAAGAPMRLALCFTAYTLQYASLSGFLPTILVDQQGFGAGLAGALTAGAILANLAGGLSTGGILHLGIPRSLAIAVALSVMGLAALGVFAEAVPFTLAYALILVLSAVGGMVPAMLLGAVPEFAPAPDLVPTTNGLVVQGSHLGQLAGPPVLGAIAAAAGGWYLSPVLFLAAAGCGVLLALGLRGWERRQAA
jgi:MFS family permease